VTVERCEDLLEYDYIRSLVSRKQASLEQGS
jgi:hypothetical protein